MGRLARYAAGSEISWSYLEEFRIQNAGFELRMKETRTSNAFQYSTA